MANDSADGGYRLVLFDAPEETQAVRDLLCRVTGIHPTDAMQWVARAPGIWPWPLSKEQAAELLDGLYELELPAEARLAEAIPNLAPPRTIHSAACLPEGFRVKGLRGEPTHWVPWDKLEMVSAGMVEAHDEFREVVPPTWVSAVSSGLNALLRRPQMIARKQRATRVIRDPYREMILVRREPRIAFRVVENRMNYAYLADRLRTSASENFPLVLADLRLLATSAFFTDSTLGLLGEAPEAPMFDSSQALLDYSTHRLLWSWYRKDRDAQGQSTES